MVIPVVTGAFGTMSKRIHQYKIKIDIPPEIISIQKTAILGIAYTLQRVLGIKKVGWFQMSSNNNNNNNMITIIIIIIIIIITTTIIIITNAWVN